VPLIFIELWPKTINTRKRQNWVWQDKEKISTTGKLGTLRLKFRIKKSYWRGGEFLNQEMFLTLFGINSEIRFGMRESGRWG
jgi:hypothetical protein